MGDPRVNNLATIWTDLQRTLAASPEVDPTTPDKLLDQWCHVSVEGGVITGFMSLCPDGYLDMAFVLPEVMGKGHAARIYEVLLAHAKDHDATGRVVAPGDGIIDLPTFVAGLRQAPRGRPPQERGSATCRTASPPPARRTTPRNTSTC